MTENGLHLGVINERQIMSVVPLERWGTAHEIADVVCYLASDQASYVTGQTLYVDGGWNAGILPDALNFIKQDDE
jgi:NAD(P)-dependent dehydrogenase (short-subunit alcohol dehydrogenase family)